MARCAPDRLAQIRFFPHMTEKMRVNNVLGKFRDWAQPWTYRQATLAEQALSQAEIQLVNEIWAEVNDAKYWVAPSLKTGSELAREGLRTLYPWLDNDAVENLIRGASYEWK
jgi:hypothetical protein